MADTAAVRVRNAVLSYGRGKNSTLVLDHLDMTVPQGSIYALLGASGCGKTTLLGCITGLQRLEEGDIEVLGGVPGTKGSGVPGPRIGYMPQNVALVNDFNIREVFHYFGWLFGMSNSHVAERYSFLSDLLQLPPGSRMIGGLSGGESRRVSFAVALIQSPELLILDEPTVGLDSILRQSIWDYLAELTRDRQMTIILTTHYIEEARYSHQIGLMRKGKFLAETSPNNLIAQYNCSTLEEVFLILSQKQEAGESTSQLISDGFVEQDFAENEETAKSVENTTRQISFGTIQTFTDEPLEKINISRHLYRQRMKALFYKQVISLIRSPGITGFLCVLPVLVMFIFFLAIGGDPQNLNIAIVNDELDNCDDHFGDTRILSAGVANPTCLYSGLSCVYLDRLNDSKTNKIYYKDKESAFDAVRTGQAHGVLHFPANFSSKLQQRTLDGFEASDDTLLQSQLSVWLDISANQIGLMLKRHFFEVYLEFAQDMAVKCNFSKKLVKPPLLFNDPVFGTINPNFSGFAAPGIILSLTFYLSLSLTSWTIIQARTEGIWERNLVAGVSTVEILSSYLTFQCVSMLIPCTETLLVSFLVFDLTLNGSIVSVLVLVLTQAVTGAFYGLLLSVTCRSFIAATYVSMGTLFSYLLMGGIAWPLEGMQSYLMVVSQLMPGTRSSTSLRNILERGLSWTHPLVWPGFVVPAGWILGLGVVCGLIMRRSVKR